MNRTHFLWMPLLGLWLTSLPARAEPSGTELDRARGLFAAAAELQATRHWRQAAAKYREAAAIKDTPGLRFRAGYCEAQSQRLLEAKHEYELARALLRHHPAAYDVRRLLPDALARLDSRIPRLVVELHEPARGIEFRLDSKRVPAGRLGAPILLNPGEHSVRLTTRMGQKFLRRVDLIEGDRRHLVARLEPNNEAPARPPRENRVPTSDRQVDGPTDSWSSIALLSGSGLAALGVGAGVGFLWSERRARGRYNERARNLDTSACREPDITADERCRALRNALGDQRRAEQRARYSIATAGAGAAIALTSAWLGSWTNVTTSAMFTPHGATVTLKGSL